MIRRRAHSGSAHDQRRDLVRRTPLIPPPSPVAPTWVRVLWAGTFAVVGLLLLWMLRPVLAILAGSAAIAYLLDPVVDWFERRGASRSGTIAALFGLATALLLLTVLLLIPVLSVQAREIGVRLGAFFQNMDTRLEPTVAWIADQTGYRVPLETEELRRLGTEWITENAAKVQLWATNIARGLFTQGLGLLNTVLNLTLLPIFVFYLLRDWDRLVSGIAALIPPRHLPRVARIATEVDGRLSAFVRGQVTVCLALAVMYSVGLLLVGVDLAVVVGVMSGLLFIIPYFGTAVGIVLSVILALLEFGLSWQVVAAVLVFVIGQFVEGTFLTPRIVGEKVGLHPLVVIIALLVGAALLGIWGMLLAIPVTAVLSVLAGEWLHLYFKSAAFQGDDHGE